MFDLLENNNPMATYFQFDQEQAELRLSEITDQMKDLGYDNVSALINLGSLFIFLNILLVKALFLALIQGMLWAAGYTSRSITRWHKSLYFGQFIVIILEGAMEFLISGWINMRDPVISKYLGDQISLVVSIFILVLTLIVMPLVYIWLLRQP